jgi:hypothetical protein
MRIIDCDQGTDQWFRARMGMPTASEFSTVMAKGKDGGASKTRETYMLKLAGEILTGEPMDSFSNGHTERGKEMEAEARELYAFMRDCEPERVGFIVNGDMGCSPDSLVGEDGAVEIKTKLPHLQIKCLLSEKLPAEHRAQCQGILLVTGRKWIDFVSYWPGLPLHVIRESPDEEYQAKLTAAIEAFNVELAETVERIRRMAGEPSPLKSQLEAA